MSQLYIRVMTGFFTHRKTNKLRRFLGNDAFWVPPRLWAYAAENQPDGDFSTYTSEDLADVLGCSSNAQALLQALKECEFIDKSGRVHDWEFHNSYHKSFAIRARKAAAARWSKAKSTASFTEDKGQWTVDSGASIAQASASIAQASLKHCSSIASSIQGELPTEADAVAMTMTAGVPVDFVKYIYDDWFTRGGHDAGNIPVKFLPYVMKRWKREQSEWKNKTHKGNKTNGSQKPNPRNAGTGVDSAEQSRTIVETLARREATHKNSSPSA